MRISIVALSSGGSAAIVIVIALLSMSQSSSAQYAISLDPFKDPQDLFTMARVTIRNTGNAPLTDIIIDYGGYSDKIPVLRPGERLILSPPTGNDLKQVTVTSNEGIHVTMPYRTPTKMPGMMGS